MNSLIIYAHPYKESFCAGILSRCLSCLDSADLIDLYEDGFNPVMSGEELALYNKGESKDPLVPLYQKKIAAAGRLIFIFPVWWYDAPAILKGFFDKVLLKDFAFDDSNGFDGLLNQEVLLITTSGDKNTGIEKAVKPLFLDHLFPSVGLTNCRWLNCETVQEAPSSREGFLEEVARALKD